MAEPIGRDPDIPFHLVDTGEHLLLCLVGIDGDGKPVYKPHGDEDDLCGR